MRTERIVLLTALASACFPACRLTDHNEQDGEVTTGVVNIPASGYEETDPAELPKFQFDSVSLDFGRVSQGTEVTKQYTFTNAGKSDLLITEVRGSCGCTVAKDWPRHPVKPGDGGTITVTFDSDGRSGRQEKVISVVANTYPATTGLFLHGDVIAPEGTLQVE